MANLKPINEEFSGSSYNNDSRLSQPSSGVRQVRNVETKQSYDPDKRRGGIKDRAASSWGESMQSNRQTDSKPDQKTQAAGIRSVTTSGYQNAGSRVAGNRASNASGGRNAWQKKVPKSVGGKMVGRTVTLSIWSWSFFVWLWFQLPFTILSLIFMALTEAIYQFTLSLEPTVEDGMVVSVGKKILDAALDVTAWFAGKVLDVFNIDIELLHPANFFLMTHVLVVLVGWGILFTIGIIYTMTGQKAFSGTGAGGKNAFFILAFVGYAIPIINLLPLFFFWTLMVLKNPK
jgi:hypothetical protein